MTPHTRFNFVVPAALTLAEAGDFGGHDDKQQAKRHQCAIDVGKNDGQWPLAVYTPIQRHTTRVRIVTRSNCQALRIADGVLTANRSLALAITVADCLPIFIAAPTRGLIGLLHSGRRSTGILKKALAIAISRFGCRPDEIHLLFAPCIHACCYEVSPQIGRRFQKTWGNSAVDIRDGAYYLDMLYVNRVIAEMCGIRHIVEIDHCTACMPQYHSYRRAGSSNYQRMLAIINHVPHQS